MNCGLYLKFVDKKMSFSVAKLCSIIFYTNVFFLFLVNSLYFLMKGTPKIEIYVILKKKKKINKLKKNVLFTKFNQNLSSRYREKWMTTER